MTTVKCPQCGKEDVQIYSALTGLLASHRDPKTRAMCPGSFNKAKDLPFQEGARPRARWVPGLHREFNP